MQLISLSLTFALVSTTFATVCDSGIYKALAPLQSYEPAKAFCAKNYPASTVTVTGAAPRVRRAAPASSTVSTTKASSDALARKGTTTTTVIVQTPKSSATSKAISTTKSGKDPKEVLFSSLAVQAGAVVRSLCSCIQKPKTVSDHPPSLSLCTLTDLSQITVSTTTTSTKTTTTKTTTTSTCILSSCKLPNPANGVTTTAYYNPCLGETRPAICDMTPTTTTTTIRPTTTTTTCLASVECEILNDGVTTTNTYYPCQGETRPARCDMTPSSTTTTTAATCGIACTGQTIRDITGAPECTALVKSGSPCSLCAAQFGDGTRGTCLACVPIDSVCNRDSDCCANAYCGSLSAGYGYCTPRRQ